MSRVDTLPPDQKAVLQLLLKQGKGYDELSQLLRIEPEAVRDRALNALDALGPEEDPGISPERQDQIGDYLLGQLSGEQAQSTRTFLEGSAAGRAWARVVACELGQLASHGLPAIPEEGTGMAAGEVAAEPEPGAEPEAVDGDLPVREPGPATSADHHPAPATTATPVTPPEPVAVPAPAPRPTPSSGAEPSSRPAASAGAGERRSSKLGGVILILGIAALLALVLVVALGGDDEDKGGAAKTSSTQTSTTQGGTRVLAQINLRAANEGSKALGVANIVEQEGQRAIALIGQDIKPASPRYAVWLYNSASDSQFLGFAPPVRANGRLQGLAGVPENIAKFREVIVTREKVDRPKSPGTIVLRGNLKS